MNVRSRVALGIIVTLGCAAQGLQAQAFDSLGRPRPLASAPLPSSITTKTFRVCEFCRATREPAFRIISAGNELLFMSPADTSANPKAGALYSDIMELNPSHIVDIKVMKSTAVMDTFGSGYRNGIVIVTLDAKGTEDWFKAAATRTAKPAPAPSR